VGRAARKSWRVQPFSARLEEERRRRKNACIVILRGGGSLARGGEEKRKRGREKPIPYHTVEERKVCYWQYGRPHSIHRRGAGDQRRRDL